MRIARPLGLTPDGNHLIVVTDDGEEIRLLADERLNAALRGDRARLGQLEIEMDSALRPRDIQARIRAGESVDDVARAAGVPADRIQAFAAPVIAEREHVAGLAQTHPVRRRGETTSHRTLRNTVTDALAARGVPTETVRWDAWKIEDRRWQVQVAYESGSAHHTARFVYEQTGRFSTAANDDARWLIGEDSSAHGPQPGRRPATKQAAPTLVDDDLALVRAVASPATPPEVPAADTDDIDTEDAFREAELAEVDGVYDIVEAEPPSQLDVLYDMLSSFDEDSVKIYAGLISPPAPAPNAAVVVVDAPLQGEVEGDLGGEEFTGVLPDAGPAASEASPAPDEPEQLALLDDVDAPEEPAPAKRPPRRRRASVPSWDEIMFGSPHKDR